MNDSDCLAQIAQRRFSHLKRKQFDTGTAFQQVTAHVEMPSSDEGFTIEVVRRTARQ